MKSLLQVTRRRFLGAAAAAGLITPGALGFGADSEASLPNVRSTDHFWYRPQPEGLFVDSQRDNKAFGFSEGTVLLSEDNGRTSPHGPPFPTPARSFSCILENGNVLFSAQAKLYLSTDNLKTYRQITVKKQRRPDYLPHTPKNAGLPGWYFHSPSGDKHVRRERVGNAHLGQLLQRDRRRLAGQHLLPPDGPRRWSSWPIRSVRIPTIATMVPEVAAARARRWATPTTR